MTVSATSHFEFNVGQICKIAYRDAELLNVALEPSLAQTVAARELLQLIIDDTQAMGLFAKVVEFKTVTLATGIDAYSLDTSVLDVVGTAMFKAVGAVSETPVAMIQRDDYNALTNKTTPGRPTQYYPHRTAATVELRFWPVPSSVENGATVKVQAHRFRAIVASDSNVTLDFERPWTGYLIAELAARLAKQNGMPLERVMILRGDAAAKLQACKALGKQRGNQQVALSHSTPWSSR